MDVGSRQDLRIGRDAPIVIGVERRSAGAAISRVLATPQQFPSHVLGRREQRLGARENRKSSPKFTINSRWQPL